MAGIFVRRSTGILLGVVTLLVLVVVGLLVAVFSGTGSDPSPTGVPTTDAESIDKRKPERIRKQQPWEKEYRIPTSSKPIHYDLYLHPNLESGKYTGRVSILITVRNPMKYLVTHFKQMNITKTKLRSMATRNIVDLMDFFEYAPNQFWVVVPRLTLPRGNYSLELDFNGDLEGDIVGFYKSVYTDAAGQKRSIATSKFQPTDARGAFPCFDEPSFKSTFTITMVRPSEGYIALSNMPQQSEVRDHPERGLTEVKFQRSVPMVTYLVCFIVCDFDYVETRTQDNKLFRVYSTKEQLSRTHYARDLGVNILNFFEKYFDVEYPLPKQDMIAIPDFVSGAMEHWGLITYREVNLLYDDSESSSYNKQRVAAVVGHELAHMWFGNLVTLSWWDDLWLNEGFASYVEYKGVHHHEPTWDMMDQFVVTDLQKVFKLDGKLSSHPIVQPVDNPDQITEIFDEISYSKGASVLRMLDNFMGEKNFRAGVRNFLRKFKYGNAVTNDLWVELGKTSREQIDIAGIMDTWTRQMGYPVLDVARVGQNTIEMRQKRFLENPDAVGRDDSPYGYKWDIPVTYITGGGQSQLVWLRRADNKLTVTLPSGSPWVKVNVGQHGYYRVNYEQPMWEELTDLLMRDHEALSPPDRSSLLDDVFSLAAASQQQYSTALHLTRYLASERHYVPWRTIATHLTTMDHLLHDTAAYPLFRKYVLKLVADHVERVGWRDDGGHLERRLRPLLLSLACKSGHEGCLSNAKEKMQQSLLQTNTYLPPNLRTVVYKYGMLSADYTEWEQMLQRYVTESNAQEKSKLLVGLTSTSTNWITSRFLAVSRNESIVRSQDYLAGLSNLAANPASTKQVWDFIKSEWQYLVDRFSLSNRYLGRTVKAVVSRFTTTLQLQDAERFFEQHPDAGAGARAREQALEGARKNIAWISRNTHTLHQWLKHNSA